MADFNFIRQDPQYFLDLIQKSRRGKLKLYIGMIAGVGKTYRMLVEAHALLRNGVDVRIGYIETHEREDTQALVAGVPEIPRRKIFYKGKELEEMDLDTIIALHPEVVLVDELAHTNVEGSKNQKRWLDVMDILNAGINVISAVNIQHFESLNEDVKAITGVEVAERIPDSVLKLADEVVNIDLPADELITRLKEGKIYKKESIEPALNNFFKGENILQLRELALKEVASAVERIVETEITRQSLVQERFLACISSNEVTAKNVIRKTARLANYYHSKWFVLYVETRSEGANLIPLDKQRYLINNFQMATEMGAEIIKIKDNSIDNAILEQAKKNAITTICIGKPHLSLLQKISARSFFFGLVKKMIDTKIDLVVLN